MAGRRFSESGRLSRRDALRGLAGAGLGIVSAWRSQPALAGAAAWRPAGSSRAGTLRQIPSWPTELRELAPGVLAYTQMGGPGVAAGSLSNAGVIAGEDGLMAIDALGPPIHAKAFIAAATQATGLPFGRLVNTHHHRDHTNGNCFFLPAEIVAHEFCRRAVIEAGIPERPYAERPEWQEGMEELVLAPPATTFSDRLTYRVGGTVVELLSASPAHTWGDLMAYLPEQKILFAGDLAFFYVTPAGHNAHLTRWLAALDRIDRMDVETIVPGHGPIGGKRELAALREYLDLSIREIGARYRAGLRPGEAAADVDLGRFQHWSNPERIAVNAVRLYAELDGTIEPAVAGLTNPDETTRQAMEEYRTLRAARGR